MTYQSQLFTPTELKGQDFDNCTFIKCKFAGVNLSFSNFTSCEFRSCDLSGIQFEMTSFTRCRFPESKLSNLDFAPCQFKDCDFSHSIIRDSVFQQFKSAQLNDRKKYNLVLSNFSEADLSNTIFNFCDLTHANFQKTILENVVLDKCNLKNADFTAARIAGMNFTDSKIDHTILDINGFLSFGASKGFILEPIQE